MTDSDLYDSLVDGNLVHFHHSFGRFVRCQVVTAQPDVPAEDVRAGEEGRS